MDMANGIICLFFNWKISIYTDRIDDGTGNTPKVFSRCLSQDRKIPVDP